MSPLLLSLTWVGSDHTRWEGGWLLLGWGEGVYRFQVWEAGACGCEHPSFFFINMLLLQVRWSLTQVATPGLGMGVQGGAGSNPAPSGLLITVFLFQVQGRFSAAASPALGVGSRVFLLFTVQLRMLRHLPWV